MDEDVQHWLTEVQKYKSEFSDAHEHVLKMSEATRAHDVDTSNAEAQVAADILKSIPWKQYDETEGNNLTYPPALNGSISQDGANPGSDISSIPPNLQYLPGFLPLPQYWYGYKPPPPSEWPSYTNPGPYSALPPLPGPPPQSLSGSAPPVAPQRANSAYQSLVSKDGTASDAHFARVNKLVGSLPTNIKQFMQQHHVKVIATDTVVGRLPGSLTLQPRGWPARQTYQNSDAVYDRAHNEVIVAEHFMSKTGMQPSQRVESVARHEIAHAVDQNMGYFSHSNKPFVDAYRSEKKALPNSVKPNLKHILQKGDPGREEAFGEMFAIANGGAASGPQIQQLIQQYFPKSLTMARSAIRSLH